MRTKHVVGADDELVDRAGQEHQLGHVAVCVEVDHGDHAHANKPKCVRHKNNLHNKET